MSVENRVQNSDKQAEIELYYELLSSGHSVGEILNAVGPTQSRSKRDDSAKLKQRQSGLDSATNIVSEAVLVNTAEATVRSTPGLFIAHEAESGRTGEPQIKDRWLGEIGSYDGKHLTSENMWRSEPEIVNPSNVDTSISREGEIDAGSAERLKLNKFPNETKRIVFSVSYTLMVSFLSVTGFLVLHPGRNAESTITSPLLDIPRPTGAIAIPHPGAAHSEETERFLTPQKPIHGSPQKIEAVAQERVSEIPREVEVAPQSASNQLGTSQRSADPATAPRNPKHEPATSVIQFPSTTPTGSVETAVRSDTGQPDMREPPEARSKNGVKGTTTVPTGLGSVVLPLGAHVTKRPKASTPRQYAEARRRIRRPDSVYNWMSRGPYYSSFDRGYSYGGPAP